MRFVLLAILIAWGAPVAIAAAIENPPSLLSVVLFGVVLIANEWLRPKTDAADPT